MGDASNDKSVYRGATSGDGLAAGLPTRKKFPKALGKICRWERGLDLATLKTKGLREVKFFLPGINVQVQQATRVEKVSRLLVR